MGAGETTDKIAANYSVASFLPRAREQYNAYVAQLAVLTPGVLVFWPANYHLSDMCS